MRRLARIQLTGKQSRYSLLLYCVDRLQLDRLKNLQRNCASLKRSFAFMVQDRLHQISTKVFCFEFFVITESNECIGDDTKAATRRSPNCIKKTKTTFCGARISVSLPDFYLYCSPMQNFAEIWQLAAEFW